MVLHPVDGSRWMITTFATTFSKIKLNVVVVSLMDVRRWEVSGSGKETNVKAGIIDEEWERVGLGFFPNVW